jgi:hypothetical protein
VLAISTLPRSTTSAEGRRPRSLSHRVTIVTPFVTTVTTVLKDTRLSPPRSPGAYFFLPVKVPSPSSPRITLPFMVSFSTVPA